MIEPTLKLGLDSATCKPAKRNHCWQEFDFDMGSSSGMKSRDLGEWTEESRSKSTHGRSDAHTFMRRTLQEPNSGNLGWPKSLNFWNGVILGLAQLNGSEFLGVISRQRRIRTAAAQVRYMATMRQSGSLPCSDQPDGTFKQAHLRDGRYTSSLEIPGARELQREPLEGRSVCEFVKILNAETQFSTRERHVRRESERVDRVARQ